MEGEGKRKKKKNKENTHRRNKLKGNRHILKNNQAKVEHIRSQTRTPGMPDALVKCQYPMKKGR